jgi:hypothetical protein
LNRDQPVRKEARASGLSSFQGLPGALNRSFTMPEAGLGSAAF